MNKKFIGLFFIVVMIGAGIGTFFYIQKTNRSNISPDLIILYATDGATDNDLLSYDVYYPSDGNLTANHSVMIYVHGGGWRTGDKSQQISDKITYFTQNGYVFISINYRLTPEVTYPVHNQDVAAAVARIYRDCSLYGGNRSRMMIMGHSAGAGIISAITTDEQYLETFGLNLSIIRAAISLDTEGYNITYNILQGDKIYLDAFGTNETLNAEASPINHISSGKNIPAFFIVTRGTEARQQFAQDFAQKLEKANIPTQVVVATNYSHEEVNAAIGDPKDEIIMPELEKFLQKVLE